MLAIGHSLPVLLLLTTCLARSPPADPSCPSGFFPGFQLNTFQYDVPFDGFEAIMKSFFDISWYAGVVVTNTTGRNNTVGATRAGPFATAEFKEVLIEIESSPTSLTMKYVSIVGELKLQGVLPQKPNETIIIGSYTEGFQILSICGGTSTWFDIFVTFCADKPVEAADLYDTIRKESLQAVAIKLGADSFIGSCP